ncbi:MAG: 3-isopropylmalate dehydratase small subunit, partial [Muribaculaceae bacterium]|nr:3-isopropylmalate dehydratase small subunit [Muribaculaceae bacterium]
HKNNELNSFVLPVVVSPAFLEALFASIAADPSVCVRVDLPAQTITNLATGATEHFDINPYKKQCLLTGLDDVEYLLSRRDSIERYEKNQKLKL